ncbi:MAG: hypothetical protein FWD95_01945 [Nocardioidaceae bacterium]|nr:hypothetical protein [Nocardioidaceae bacterium]
MTTDKRLGVLPGPTLAEGVAALRGAASTLASVTPLRPVKGRDIEGKHQGHHHDHERSGAECRCDLDSFDDAWCPRHQAASYADPSDSVFAGAQHRGAYDPSEASA